MNSAVVCKRKTPSNIFLNFICLINDVSGDCPPVNQYKRNKSVQEHMEDHMHEIACQAVIQLHGSRPVPNLYFKTTLQPPSLIIAMEEMCQCVYLWKAYSTITWHQYIHPTLHCLPIIWSRNRLKICPVVFPSVLIFQRNLGYFASYIWKSYRHVKVVDSREKKKSVFAEKYPDMAEWSLKRCMGIVKNMGRITC